MTRLTRDHVRRTVQADPRTLYQLVADVTRTPEWSPEVQSCSWVDDTSAGTVGARFTARNRRRWFRWSNQPVVVVADPDRAFAFSRTERGGGTIVWRYDLEPSAVGTELSLSYDVVRPVPLSLHVLLRVLLLVKDLHTDLHNNMITSLDRLAVIAERHASRRH